MCRPLESNCGGAGLSFGKSLSVSSNRTVKCGFSGSPPEGGRRLGGGALMRHPCRRNAYQPVRGWYPLGFGAGSWKNHILQ